MMALENSSTASLARPVSSAVHHLCPALLLLSRNFVPGAELLGVKEVTDYYEKYNPGS